MGKIWFGNAEKMMWVNCPATNIQRGRGKWAVSGGFLNGGAYAKSSPMSHRKYSIDWNLMESAEAAKIMSFYEGVYGQSPIQFVDPFAAKSNILPLHWSVPRLCAKDAPNLLSAGSARPTEVPAGDEVRRNYITNPRGAAPTGWSLGPNCSAVYAEPGAVFTHTAGTTGNAFFRVPLAALAPSTTYALRFEAEQVAGSVTLTPRVTDGFDTVAGATVVKTGSHFLITATFTTGTTPPASPYLLLDFVGTGTGEQVRSLGGTVEVGTVAGAPFDGSTSPDPTLLPFWTGAPNASPSALFSYSEEYPRVSAQFTVAGTDSTNPTLRIPVPPGKNLYVGARGSATGTAAVSVTTPGGAPVLGRNLATNPSFEATSGTVEVRRNLFPNPLAVLPGQASDFEVRYGWTRSALTGLASGPEGATAGVRATAPAGVTSGVGRGFDHGGNFDAAPFDAGHAVTPGVAYTASSWVRTSAASSTRSGQVTVRFHDGTGWVGGVTSGTPVTLTQGVWTLIQVTAVAPTGATRACFRSTLNIEGDTATVPYIEGETFDVAAPMLEAATTRLPFFAPGLPSPADTYTAWTGTANASASVLTGTGVAGAPTHGGAFALSSQQWVGAGSRSLRIISRKDQNLSYVELGGGPGGLRYGMEAGKTYTVFARGRLAAAQTGPLAGPARRLAVYHRVGSSGVYTYVLSAGEQSPNVPGEYEARITFTLPAGTTEAWPRLFGGASAGNGDVWWDDLAIIEGEYTGPWFDGSNPPAGYESLWEGAANASTSIYRQRTTVDLRPVTETAQTTMVLNDPGTVTLKLSGTGALTLNSMTAVIGTTPPTYTGFRQGEGNTGLRFVGEPTRTGYSSVLDLESVSAEFVETGAWE